MNSLGQWVREPAMLKRLALFVLSGALAVIIGFVVVSPAMAGQLIAQLGYYYMLGLFTLFVLFAFRVARARREVWRAWLRRPGWPGLVIVGATAFALWSDSFQHKVLFDEYVLQATAYHMHITKEIGSVIRAYDINGTWLLIDPFLDKRPYFFTFLLSLLHDVTGYRTANVFFLNSALTGVFFSLAYWFGRELTGRAGGFLVLALLCTMPLLGQNATSGGMEIHNLTMVTLVMCLALLYLRAPDADRLALLCLGTVLLAESRYESVIYVVPVTVVVLVGWRRAQQVFLPWAAIATPLLLIPYAWHDRYVSSMPLLWQLGAGQTERFSLQYLAGNLQSAFGFFFNFGNRLANSWYLSALGCAGLVYFLVCAVQWLRRRSTLSPQHTVALAFGAGIATNLAMLQFYYWSRLTDTVAARFALPACLLLALLAAILVSRLSRRWPAAMGAAFVGVGVYVLVSALPAMANRFYTVENLVMKEINWEQDYVRAHAQRPVLFLSNTSTIPWITWKIPCLLISVARQRGDQLRFHMDQGTFHEVLVAQSLRPTSAEGKFGVDPEDLLPDNFRLETLAEERFGGRTIRLSRLIRVDPVAPTLARTAP